MHATRDQHFITLSQISPRELQMLREIPAHVDAAGDARLDKVLHSDPVREPGSDREDEVNQDWADLVRPSLEKHLQTQVDSLLARIKHARQEPIDPERLLRVDPESADDTNHAADELGGAKAYFHDPSAELTYRLHIPLKEAESWYGALNQARLLMEARYKFPDERDTEAFLQMLQSDKIRPFLTSRFYMMLQFTMLEHSMIPEGFLDDAEEDDDFDEVFLDEDDEEFDEDDDDLINGDDAPPSKPSTES